MGAPCVVLAILLAVHLGDAFASAVDGTSSHEAEIVRTDFGPEQTKKENKNLSRSLEEGRGKKKKAMKMMRMLMSIKMIAMSVIIPAIMAVALFASWKGITISLLAFTIASIAGFKSLAGSKTGSEKSIQHVVVSKAPSYHEHWWRKLGEEENYMEDSPHHKDHSPYREYYRR